MTYFHIYEIETDQHLWTVHTEMTGRAKERVESGLMRRVDLDRFFVLDSEEENPTKALELSRSTS